MSCIAAAAPPQSWTSMQVLFLLLQLGTLGTCFTPRSSVIGCFVCNSLNNSDPGCADPFHPALSTYVPQCQAGMAGRIGLFPAQFCVKIHGHSVDGGVEVTARICSLQNMGQQCGGKFELSDVLYKGCITTCTVSGCNHAPSNRACSPLLLLSLQLVVLYSLFV